MDQVEQRQARGLVLLGDRDDEPEVRLHERALGVVAVHGPSRRSSRFLAGVRPLPREQVLARSVAVLDLLREADLVVLGEQRVLPDVGEVEPDEIFFVPLDTLLRHRSILRSGTANQRRRVGLDSTAALRHPGARRIRVLYDTDLVKRPFRVRVLTSRRRTKLPAGVVHDALRGGREPMADDVEIAILTATFDARAGRRGSARRGPRAVRRADPRTSAACRNVDLRRVGHAGWPIPGDREVGRRPTRSRRTSTPPLMTEMAAEARPARSRPSPTSTSTTPSPPTISLVATRSTGAAKRAGVTSGGGGRPGPWRRRGRRRRSPCRSRGCRPRSCARRPRAARTRRRRRR